MAILLRYRLSVPTSRHCKGLQPRALHCKKYFKSLQCQRARGPETWGPMQTARAHLGKASSPGAPGGLQLGALPGVCLHFRRDVSQFSCLSALCRGTCNSVSAQWKYACLPYMLKGTILQVNETGCKKFFFFLLCTAVQSPRRDSV